ncbi:MAG: dipeptidase PepV [Christensenellales bacterium]
MDYTKLDNIIASMREDILESIRRVVAINSVAAQESAPNEPFGKEVRRALDTFLTIARENGFEARDIDGYAGDVRLGTGEKTMGILAHLDIVPAGDGWTVDPFSGVIRDGKLYGRGTTDNKGPAVAALYAMKAVREAGIELKDAVKLIVGCDEETGMTDMRHYAQHEKLPDYGFSPDADYPLINIEKGGLGLLLSCVTGGEDGAEIPIYELYAGERCNVVPGSAYAIVGTEKVSLQELRERVRALCAEDERLKIAVSEAGNCRAKIEATGVSAHASLPHLGVNAAGMLLIALKKLSAGGGSREAIALLADKIGFEGDGKSLGIAISDEESGALTCNLGILRYDGNELSAQLDNRYPISACEETMCGQAVMTLSGKMSVRRVSGHPPLHVPKDSEIVQGLLEVYHEVTGLEAYPIAIGGGTYSRTMPNTVAFGINFPGDVDLCHMPDEYVDIEKLMLSVKIMAHAIVRLAGKP